MTKPLSISEPCQFGPSYSAHRVITALEGQPLRHLPQHLITTQTAGHAPYFTA